MERQFKEYKKLPYEKQVILQITMDHLPELSGQELAVLLALVQKMGSERKAKIKNYDELAIITGGNKDRLKKTVIELCRLRVDGMPLMTKKGLNRGGTIFNLLPEHGPIQEPEESHMEKMIGIREEQSPGNRK